MCARPCQEGGRILLRKYRQRRKIQTLKHYTKHLLRVELGVGSVAVQHASCCTIGDLRVRYDLRTVFFYSTLSSTYLVLLSEMTVAGG